MKEYIFKPHKCPRCGKKFDSLGDPVPGRPMYCKKCTNLIITLRNLERDLISEEFSIEKRDEEIARKIHASLLREKPENITRTEESITALIKTLFRDEKRRMKILNKIKKLQKEKK